MVNLTGELLLQLLDKIQIGFAFIDREGQVLYSNPQAVKMLGLAPGSPTNILYCHPSYSREQYKTALQQLETRHPGTWHKTIRINNCWVQIYLAPAFLNDTFTGAILLARDVTAEENLRRALEKANAELQQLYQSAKAMAVTDPLTGLYNRRYLEQFLNGDRPFPAVIIGVIMVDINGFKKINDTFGHRTGDHLLQQTANLLQKQIRNKDFAIRYGGDEFLLLLPECDYEQTGAVVRRLREAAAAWNKEQKAGSPELFLAVGLASGPAAQLESLIREADRAMYDDKR